ncbi:MAG: hypothetical protein ACRD04_09050 [Terriglobales bacterium]
MPARPAWSHAGRDHQFDFNQAPQIPVARIRNLAGGRYIECTEPLVFLGES